MSILALFILATILDISKQYGSAFDKIQLPIYKATIRSIKSILTVNLFTVTISGANSVAMKTIFFYTNIIIIKYKNV